MDPYCSLCGTTSMDTDCARGVCLDLKENARLRAENMILREALQCIANMPASGPIARKVAIEALEFRDDQEKKP